MMEKEIYVYIDLNGETFLVGQLWTRSRNNRQSATFEYTKEWLSRPDRFSLEPALMLVDGPQHTPERTPIFGSIGDSAPDRWGRVLMRRAQRRQTTIFNHASATTLMEIDYLLLVSDVARQGALRFSEKKDGPFLANTGKNIPPLIKLPILLSATERFIDESDTDEDLKLLLAPGSSLGGARPKALVQDLDGSLAIAKFPQKNDDYPVILWEAVALKLAARAGIQVPSWRLTIAAERPILLSKRFDRIKQQRIPYLSAMSMLSANDNEQRSYLDIADAIRQHSEHVDRNLHELWRRLLFNIMISNTDDHLRNHGFLYKNSQGWDLSPAFDLNPTPPDIKPRILTTYINFDDGTASLDLAFSVFSYFNLSHSEAKCIANEVSAAVAHWREEAANVGLKKTDIERMQHAFVCIQP